MFLADILTFIQHNYSVVVLFIPIFFISLRKKVFYHFVILLFDSIQLIQAQYYLYRLQVLID